ncbi:MAG: 7-carboxy-7-deazaguanine synthase QueE [Bacteroidetes bacterium]|nr:7-carboxy-7-deazaguanine synthase QueE [Bacteroidota bacterium]
MEEFYTIQGEGYNSGKPAYFIRVGGCDVGCHWCDVKESWDPSLHPLKSVDEVVEAALHFPAKDVVITGGEPSLYNLDYLCALLTEKGKRVFVETSGAYPLSGKWHWICLSPKKTAPPMPEIYSKAHEIKVIVFNQNDFLWAEEHAAKANADCKLYLQPEWSKIKEMLPKIIDYVQQNPKWNISLQTHKYMGIP